MLSSDKSLDFIDNFKVSELVSLFQISIQSQEKEIDLNKTCRICLNINTPNTSFNLFGRNLIFQDLSIAAALSDCLNIDIQENSSFSNCVCKHCVTVILLTFTFKQCIVKSQKFFKTHDHEMIEDNINVKVEPIEAKCCKEVEIQKLKTGLINAEVVSVGHSDLFSVNGKTELIELSEISPGNNLDKDINNSNELKKIATMKGKPSAKADKWWSKENGPPYECKICGRNFGVRYKTFNMHVVKHRVTKLPCEYCGKKFTRYNMISHVRSHTNEKPFACSQCPARFTVRGNLTRHLQGHSGEKQFVCDTCGKSYTQMITLVKHKETHSDSKKHSLEERAHMCNLCNRAFKSEKGLHLHSRLCSDSDTFCRDCSKNFSSKTNFDVHNLWHRAKLLEDINIDEFQQWVCEICKLDFSHSKDLTAHILTHMELSQSERKAKGSSGKEKIFSCTYCNKICNSKVKLELHSRLHTGEKPYVCVICLKRFRSAGTFLNHKRIHTGEKPYACEICSKCFTQKQQLKSHMVTHTGEKKYVCQFCGKKFPLNCSLTVHKRRHTGETPYICELCQKGFYDSTSLKKHKKVHENDKLNY